MGESGRATSYRAPKRFTVFAEGSNGEAGSGAVAEQALHPLGGFGNDRSDPVAVMRVDGLGVVAGQVGHLLDRRSGIEEERHRAVAEEILDHTSGVEAGLASHTGEEHADAGVSARPMHQPAAAASYL